MFCFRARNFAKQLVTSETLRLVKESKKNTTVRERGTKAETDNFIIEACEKVRGVMVSIEDLTWPFRTSRISMSKIEAFKVHHIISYKKLAPTAIWSQFWLTFSCFAKFRFMKQVFRWRRRIVVCRRPHTKYFYARNLFSPSFRLFRFLKPTNDEKSDIVRCTTRKEKSARFSRCELISIIELMFCNAGSINVRRRENFKVKVIENLIGE